MWFLARFTKLLLSFTALSFEYVSRTLLVLPVKNDPGTSWSSTVDPRYVKVRLVSVLQLGNSAMRWHANQHYSRPKKTVHGVDTVQVNTTNRCCTFINGSLFIYDTDFNPI